VSLQVGGQAVGLDVRSSGGYIVAPPSGHYTGGSYRWGGAGLSDAVTIAPDWLCDLVAPVVPPIDRGPAPTVPSGSEGDRERRYAAAALERAVREIAALQAGVGGGGRHLAILRTVRGVAGYERLLEVDAARAALVDAAVYCGIAEREARRTVDDGWAHGAAEPRAVPDRPAPSTSTTSRAYLDDLAGLVRDRDDHPHLHLVGDPPDDGRWAPPPTTTPRPVADPRPTAVDRVVADLLDRSPPPEPPPLAPPPTEAPGRPEIVATGRQLRDLVDDGWSAVLRTDSLYQRDGQVVRVQHSEHGPRIEPVGEAAMSVLLSRAADWYALRPARRGEITDGGMVRTALSPPPRAVAQAMVAVPSGRLAVLEGVVSSPVLDSAGDLVSTPGYHAGPRLWYAGGPMRRQRMSAQDAVDLILGDWLGDFPFASEADRAGALALLAQLVMRRMIPAACPVHIVEAPAQGTGKDLLVELLSMVALGSVPGVRPWPETPEERRKELLSAVSSGSGLVWLGNVRGALQDASLEALLTAYPTWVGRDLGRIGDLRVPIAGVSVVVTVNNARMSRDIADRASRIRLDAGVDRPSERTGWRHSDIRAWTAQHRERLLSAVLELVEVARQESAAWTAAWTGPRHGRYGRWSSVVGPVVAAAGLGDQLLGSRAEVAELGDPESAEWAALVTEWAQRGGQMSPAGVLATYCVDRGLLSGVLGDARTAPRALARALTGLRDRVWTVDGARWRMMPCRVIGGRPTYELRCETPEQVPDMAGRLRRSWHEERPMWDAGDGR
jgi:hypothetical protein